MRVRGTPGSRCTSVSIPVVSVATAARRASRSLRTGRRQAAVRCSRRRASTMPAPYSVASHPAGLRLVDCNRCLNTRATLAAPYLPHERCPAVKRHPERGDTRGRRHGKRRPGAPLHRKLKLARRVALRERPPHRLAGRGDVHRRAVARASPWHITDVGRRDGDDVFERSGKDDESNFVPRGGEDDRASRLPRGRLSCSCQSRGTGRQG